MSPSDAVIAITHRCNSRCTMCAVWRSKHRDLLAPAHLAKLFKASDEDKPSDEPFTVLPL